MEDKGDWVLVPRPPREAGRGNLSSTSPSESSQPLKVTFNDPATHWTDAIPIGNGHLGAMVWGRVASEIIQLNEDTLWTGTPGNYTNPDASRALSEVRHLVNNGDYVEATMAAAKLFGSPGDVYQLLGDILLEFGDSHLKYSKETYQRELTLDTATARIKYYLGDVELTREHFVSNPDQVIATKISGSKAGSLSFIVSFDSKLDHHCHVNGKNQIIMEGSCPVKRVPPDLYSNAKSTGIQFSAVINLQISDGRGVIHVLDDNKLKVEGADWAVLLIVAKSSFDGPFTNPSISQKNLSSDSLSASYSLRNRSYSDLYAHHLDDYQYIFHRVSLHLLRSSKKFVEDGFGRIKKHNSSIDLSLEGSQDGRVSTADRVKSFQTNEDPSLVELLFQFGRYLLISCSRPGTQVANLQGIWNKDLIPAWDLMMMMMASSRG